MAEKFEEKLLKMYKSAPMGADITMTIRFKKKEKTISNRKESEEQLDWQKPLPTMILPEKDYLTFDDMELEARRIMKAAETKGIPLEREIAERNRKSLSPVSSSIYEMYFPDSAKSIHSSVFLNSEDTSTNSRPKTKKRTRDRSSDLVNTEGQTASFFDIDSLSVKTFLQVEAGALYFLRVLTPLLFQDLPPHGRHCPARAKNSLSSPIPSFSEPQFPSLFPVSLCSIHRQQRDFSRQNTSIFRTPAYNKNSRLD